MDILVAEINVSLLAEIQCSKLLSLLTVCMVKSDSPCMVQDLRRLVRLSASRRFNLLRCVLFRMLLDGKLLPRRGFCIGEAKKIDVRRSVTSVRSSVRPFVRPFGPKNHRFWDPKSSFLQLYADFGESKSGHFPMSAKMSASDVRKNVRIRCPQKMSASDVRKIVRPILCKSPFGATRPCGCNLVISTVFFQKIDSNFSTQLFRFSELEAYCF